MDAIFLLIIITERVIPRFTCYEPEEMKNLQIRQTSYFFKLCCKSIHLVYFSLFKCKLQQKEGRVMYEISSVLKPLVCYVLCIYFLQIFIILNLYFLIFSCFDRGLVVSQQTYPYRPNPLSPRNILNATFLQHQIFVVLIIKLFCMRGPELQGDPKRLQIVIFF